MDLSSLGITGSFLPVLETRGRSLIKEQASPDDVLEQPSLQHCASFVLWASNSKKVDNNIDFAAIFQSSDKSWTEESFPFPEPAFSPPLSANPPHTRTIRGSRLKGWYDDDDNDNDSKYI
jgi:hypothetical protein